MRKLIIEIDTTKLPQDMSVRTRYFTKLLHEKVEKALERFNLSVGEFDGAIVGRPIVDNEQDVTIGRIYLE